MWGPLTVWDQHVLVHAGRAAVDVQHGVAGVVVQQRGVHLVHLPLLHQKAVRGVVQVHVQLIARLGITGDVRRTAQTC